MSTGVKTKRSWYQCTRDIVDILEQELESDVARIEKAAKAGNARAEAWKAAFEKATTVKHWEVWSEGYAATGESSDATLHGVWPGATFKEAVEAYVGTRPEEERRTYFDVERLTYWACRFFDNEADARKSYG